MAESLFKGKHFESDIILLCVRWYLRIQGIDHYLYRAVDSHGATIDFWLSKHRDKTSAKPFFEKALVTCHNSMLRVITTDKYQATEQDQRFIKKIVKPMMGFHSFKPACAAVSGIEVIHMIHKGQAGRPDVISVIKLINRLFGVE